MNNFDASRKDEMNNFLNILYNIAKQGNLTKSIIYNFLMTYNLKPIEKDASTGKGISNLHLFDRWKQRFENKANTYAFRDMSFEHFFQFVSKKQFTPGNFIKLYVPLDYAHLENGANLLFDFLDSEQIQHYSKVSKIMRVDNVIIRLNVDDVESLNKIVSFISNHPYFKGAMNKPNPFIPTINGVGVMKEHGNSYNTDISYYILNFLELCKNNNQDYVTCDDFKNYLEYCQKNNITFNSSYFDNELLETFNNSYYGKSYGFTTDQKREIFMDALKNTFLNYGMRQTIEAITQIAVNRDYNYISNKNSNLDLRGNLQRYLSVSEIETFINELVYNIDINNAENNLKQNISIFANNLFKNTSVFAFDEACLATLKKYGSDYLMKAIDSFMQTGNASCFTRFIENDTHNYRSNLKLVDINSINDIIFTSLMNRGIDASNLDFNQIISEYVGALERSVYTDLSDRPQFGK